MTGAIATAREETGQGGRPPSAGGPLTALRRKTAWTWTLSVASLLLFVLAWHVATFYRLDLHIRFINVPTPQAVAARAVIAFGDARFLQHIVVSLQRIGAGFALAALAAIPLGLVMGRFQIIRVLVYPVVEVLRPIPAIAWVPMSIMLWPTSEESIVFITFLGAFFPVLINTLHGVAAIDPALIRASRSLGANEAALFRHVFLPGALPHIFTGLTVGMGVAWVSLIAAEMISGQFGIGYFTWEAYSLVQYADIVLGMLLIGVLGLLSSGLLRLLGVVLMPWQPRQSPSNREAAR
ncbi:ABC transporter permease [Telmatospirillum siberiense]|uniref:ABC transporter permease n=1 Tax=Telmatospirillum siberiense TaxID=382514 RepID=A0A2N3PP18_9PROT|nr:ABC transporter permease [Telmatospirillum siberiense]PKU22138.1 ABC transporter permease [Telmatospirillum siberiense]